MFTSAVCLALVAVAHALPGPDFAIDARAAANAASNAGGLALDSTVVQTGSASDGVVALGSEAFQAPSATSTNNFINFCKGKTLTNGLQFTTGSCNGIRKTNSKTLW